MGREGRRRSRFSPSFGVSPRRNLATAKEERGGFAMKLGLTIGYSGAEMRLPLKRILCAEELGYDSVWTAESYGSDAVTPLAFIAAHTRRIRLGTGLIQLAARTPANSTMCAGTVDALAGGNRFILGLS